MLVLYFFWKFSWLKFCSSNVNWRDKRYQAKLKLLAGENEMDQILQYDKSEVWCCLHQFSSEKDETFIQ